MNALRLHWDAVEGWVVDVPAALSGPALQRVIDWAVPKQIDRYRSLPPGVKKEELRVAIERLRAGAVRQRVVGSRGDGKGDLLLFSAPRPVEDRKIISIGARLSWRQLGVQLRVVWLLRPPKTCSTSSTGRRPPE